MRSGRLALSMIGVCGGLVLGGSALTCEQVPSAALTEEARLALDVGCRGHHGRAAHDCRRLLQRLYLAGALDPDKTLRAYCDAVKTARWGASRPAPPEMCVERYGGWKES